MKKQIKTVIATLSIVVFAGVAYAEEDHAVHHPAAGMGHKMDMHQMMGMMHDCMEMHHDGKMCEHEAMEECQKAMRKEDCRKNLESAKKQISNPTSKPTKKENK